MKNKTADCEKCLSNALDFFYSHNGSYSIRKVATKFKVNHVTLGFRIDGKQQSIALNGGHNKLLTFIQLGELFMYIRRQAFARFPCT